MWYFWMDHDDEPDELFGKLSLPIDSTVMFVKTTIENYVQIYDVYGGGRPSRKDRLAGVWDAETQKLIMNSFWRRRNNLQGMELRVTGLSVCIVFFYHVVSWLP